MVELPRPDPPAVTEALGAPSSQTFVYWEKFFSAHPTTPLDLKLYIDIFRKKRRFKDIEAAFVAYVRHVPKGSATQFWMYGDLAVAMKINRGEKVSPADVDRIKVALGTAALLALKDGNPNFTLSVADQLLLFGYYDVLVTVQGKPKHVTVNDLLDEVTKKVPHRAEPLLLALDVARRTVDPKRMATGAEQLLSLGWPKVDDQIRAEVHRQVDDLVDELNGTNRSAEAEELEGMLPGALGRDLFIRLAWEGDSSLDLLVEEPLGVTANHFTPRTVSGGSLIKEGHGNDLTSVYVCPRAFPGDYTVRVQTIFQNPDKPPTTTATLEIITRDGLPGSKKEVRKVILKVSLPTIPSESAGKLAKGPGNLLPKSDPIPIHLANGRRKEVLPYSSMKPEPEMIVVRPVRPVPVLVPAQATPEEMREAMKKERARRTPAKP